MFSEQYNNNAKKIMVIIDNNNITYYDLFTMNLYKHFIICPSILEGFGIRFPIRNITGFSCFSFLLVKCPSVVSQRAYVTMSIYVTVIYFFQLIRL